MSVRLCFLVKVRKATGRRVAGGRSMGSIERFDGAGGSCWRIGCAGVPNAGEDEGMELACEGIEVVLNRGVVRVKLG